MKKLSWILLYLAVFVPVGCSVFYLSEKNLPLALIASSVSMFIYTLLIIKDLRFISSISFFTMLLVSLLLLGIAGKQTDGIFVNVFDEKVFMLIQPLIMLFLLVNFVFWSRTKQGLKKIIALVFISLSVFMLVVYGTNSPAYHQNFVYTRANILILLIFGIFLMIKKKKLLGILGILLSMGTLLLSTSMFSKKAYTLEDKEQEEVVAYVDPMAKEMFGYYNEKDFTNFCKYCGLVLKNMIDKDPITIDSKREASGPYIYFDEPSKVIRKSGRYYVEYPIKFQKVENLMYLTVVIESISADDLSIYGYSLSEEQGLHTNSGNENERDKQ